MSRARRPERFDWLLAAALTPLLAALTLSVFWPVVGYGFVQFDDPLYVTLNPHVREGLTAGGLRWAFNVGHAGNWHPVTWLSHMLDVELFGVAPGFHHLGNLLLHAVNVVLVYLTLILLWERAHGRPAVAGACGACALVAAVFAIHPQRMESVAWISERKDVLSALFWWLALLAYLAWTERRTAARALAVATCFALALMAKPMAVTLPLVLLVLDAWPLRRLPADRPAARGMALLVAEKLPLIGLAAIATGLTVVAQARDGAISSLTRLGPAERVTNAVVAAATYVVEAVWPVERAAIYPFPIHGHPAWSVVAAGLLLAAISMLAIVWCRRRPWLAAGWAWYAITVLPVIGLIHVGLHWKADRYTYIPQIGLVVALVWAAAELTRRLPGRTLLRLAAGLAAVGALAASTRAQLPQWRDTKALFGRAAEVVPGNYVALYSLALQHANELDLDEAVRLGRQAVAAHPGFYKALEHLGWALSLQGELDEARELLERSLRLRPDYPWSHLHLGQLDEMEGDDLAAVESFLRAVEADPSFDEAWFALGRSYERLDQGEAAVEAYRRAGELSPGRRDVALRLGALHAKRGEGDAARRELRRAAELAPRDPRPLYVLGLVEIAARRLEAAGSIRRELEAIDSGTAARLADRIRRARRGDANPFGEPDAGEPIPPRSLAPSGAEGGRR